MKVRALVNLLYTREIAVDCVEYDLIFHLGPSHQGAVALQIDHENKCVHFIEAVEAPISREEEG